MSSYDTPLCVGCGREMLHLLRFGYRRCNECVAMRQPHSLALARRMQASRRRSADNFDPAGRAAA